ERDARASFDTADAALKSAQARLEVSALALTLAKEEYTMAEERYRQGKDDNSDAVLAQIRYGEVLLDDVATQAMWVRALVNWYGATGQMTVLIHGR
ncbi:MAG: TolC family protein, partial [Proteobacteria bacterium]|nr:TolC family protein [Pseudomonadota bacterium]